MLALGLVLSAPLAAAGATPAPSNWWYDRYGVAAAQAAGITGDGVKVAVIDGQINSSLPVFQGADLTVHEPGMCGDPAATTTVSTGSLHGTDITALLIGNGTGTGAVRGIAPKAHVTFYADGVETAAGSSCMRTIDGLRYSPVGLALRQAVADGNRIISISQGATEALTGDVAAIAQAIAQGVVIVASDSNSAAEASRSFPAVANGVVSVNAFDEDGTLQKQSDGTTVTWKDTVVVAAGTHFPSQGDRTQGTWGGTIGISGASNATPLVAGMLADALQKYPKATGNQLIQSLIHNTTADDHPLKFEADSGYGYGPASLSHLLKVDPTQYPDTNPLMTKAGSNGTPTQADVDKAKGGGQPSPSASAASVPTGGGSSGLLLPILVAVGVVVLVIVIVVVIVLVVVLGRRRRPVRGGI